MLDIKFIRENAEAVRKMLADRRVEADLDGFLDADRRFRLVVDEVNSLKHEKNVVSKEIAAVKDPALRKENITRMQQMGQRLKELDTESNDLDQRRNELRLTIPNMPLPDVPVGPDASANATLSSWGVQRMLDFEPEQHTRLGSRLGILDMERGAKVSGSGFYVLKGAGARMELALARFMMDIHREQGYTEIWPPALCNSASMTGTGQLPKFEDDMYRLTGDDLYLVPTAEVPVTNLHRDEILEINELPIRYQAFSPCFRREAGRHAGEEGIIRVHQFSKVELVTFTTPEGSEKELELLTDNAMEVLRRLELPHRKLLLCTGDMTFSSAKTYDIEVHSPAGDRWLEVSSCSNFSDFQARRAMIKFRRQPHLPSEFLHTLNGSGLAIGRTMVAIIENYQREDGSVEIPPALRPYMGGMEEVPIPT
ncbi:MAG: serine--tRNA ligase [Candidatus Thermoplasmatota archaeon]|nr:serine--tRNA ligase [Candidatus Thermoplasmatota archaeon]